MKLKRKYLVYMIALLLFTCICLKLNVIILQKEYDKLSNEYILLLEEQMQYMAPEPLEKEEQSPVFIPDIHSDITSIHTTEQQLQKFINENDLEVDADNFYKLGCHYGVDSGFALSMWIWETGWGKSGDPWLYHNNPAGIRCGIDYCSYETEEEGFTDMFELLQSYADGSIAYVGTRKTPAAIRAAWSETDDVDKIVEIWSQIGGI